MVSKDRVYQSLELMADSYIECQNFAVEETCDFFHFNKIIAIVYETYNGVLHACDLLAQHMVVLGASVCLYPLKFAIFGEVGETTIRKYLERQFNLFQSVEDLSYDSAAILRDLSFYSNKTIIFCEKWCENTYKHYLHQQTISGKTRFTTNSLDYIILYLVRVRTFS